MSKYSRTLKLQIAQQCLDGATSNQLSRQYSIPKDQIQYWTAVYAIHGTEAFKPTVHANSAESKLNALNLMWKNSWTIREASANLNFSSPGTLSIWLDRYKRMGFQGLVAGKKGRRKQAPMKVPPKPDDEKTVKELQEEIAYLKAENAVLKKFQELKQAKSAQTKKKRK